MANIKCERSETIYTIGFTQKEFDVIFALLAMATVDSTNCGLKSINSGYRVTIEEDTPYNLYCQFKRSRSHI